ncbi:MAG: serine hydrolase domain-containing protein [Erythrobacter sp.]|nr:serine hydrolase domain-containing protein [Erythrobacter sp.]
MIRSLLVAAALLVPVTAEARTPPPAAVVVAFDREGVTPLIAEGVRNFESMEPVEPNDPVRIASISKLVMAIAAMRLVDEGKLDLDADVSEYLGWRVRSPGFPDAPVTLAQLMAHRAGLRDAAGYIIPLGESLEQKLADPASWYPDAPPGEAPFEYANLGSPVVATVLEAASGERYDRLIERLVFAPLGITACLNWIGCSPDMAARAVALYRHTGEPARDFPGDLPPACSIPVAEGIECTLEAYQPGTNGSIFSPQGGVRIGMIDLAKLGQALMKGPQGGLMSEDSFERFGRTAYEGENEGQEFFCTYGLHLQIIELGRQPCLDILFDSSEAHYIGHSGEAYGLQSGLWFDGSATRGFAYFRTQAPPPAGGEDTGGFTQGERDLIARARAVLGAEAND